MSNYFNRDSWQEIPHEAVRLRSDRTNKGMAIGRFIDDPNVFVVRWEGRPNLHMHHGHGLFFDGFEEAKEREGL